MSASVALFDLGGVLLPFDRERRVTAMAQALGAPPEAVRGLVDGGIAERLDLGQADEADLADAMSELAGRPVRADEARSLWLSVFEAPNESLWGLAVELRQRMTTAALSDNPGFVRAVFPTTEAFDHLFLSCELGVMKPAPDVFRAVTERLQVAPRDVVFVDDSAANVGAALAAGWDAIVYRSNAQLMAELKDRGMA